MKLNKKFSLLIATGAFILGLSACTKPTHETQTIKKSDSHIALISDVNGVKDNSLNQSAWQGLKNYGTKNNLSEGNNGYNYFIPKDYKDYQASINDALDKKFSTIISVGYMIKPTIVKTAKNNPHKNFVVIDTHAPKLKNVSSISFKNQEGAYLAGVAAAYTTKSNTVGIVLGQNSKELNTFKAGFIQGVVTTGHKLHKHIKVINQTVGNFSDVNKAHDIAQEMYDKKADVIFQVAGKSGQGVFKAAKEVNQAQPVKQKVWVIGSDEDQTKLGNYQAKGGQPSNFTLTSVIKSADLAVEKLADETAKGKFPAGKNLSYGLKNNGISLVQGNLSYHTWIQVQKAKQKIIYGKIKVERSLNNN
ncbi:BMP family lipoprotein [Lactobacillus taiwanensis]|uniref:BMP family lipoprotein n=1 Tax=Lactobacillus taiwanensis TaxID=508451 RepID=UPI00242E8D46|nr:BMP family ABC transporter substrate-binding protein [Lactobacillus taiwanensis]